MEDYVSSYLKKTPGSAKLFARAAMVMPGGVSHGLRFFPPYPLYIEKAHGARIWDVDGNEYIDLWMGHYAHILGHCPEVTTKKIVEYAARGAHWGIVHPYEVEFAEVLCRIIPCAEKVRFGVSGTEATMYAVRLARAYTGRKVVLKVRGGWHGANTDLAVAIHVPMDEPESAGLLPCVTEFTRTFSFNDDKGTAEAISYFGKNLAAVIIEGVGQLFIPPKDGYLQMIRRETSKVGAILIFDEVITGFRLGLQGAQGRYGVIPDLATFGKVAGGGMNLGLVAGKKEIMELSAPLLPKGKGVLMGGGTFSCMPPAMVAGLSMVGYLEEHEKEVYPSLEAKGERVRRGIEDAFRSQGIHALCFGVGSLFTTCFPKTKDVSITNNEEAEIYSDASLEREFHLRMLNKGVYTVNGGGAISTAHTNGDIEKIIAAAAETAAEMAARQGGNGRK
jgi:glutamate-1-semialdehyde 2,1-aminomutase